MIKITFKGNETTKIYAPKGSLLSDIFKANGIGIAHPCSGNGICGKCSVIINGQQHLSCKYILNSDVEVEIPGEKYFNHSVFNANKYSEELCFCVDIGTTTLAIALISEKSGEVIECITALNPQRVYGADVISRIKYCTENSPKMLQKTLNDTINELCLKMLYSRKISRIKSVYIAGNTTMLHTFLGKDCSSMGISPYKPQFLEKVIINGEEIGFGFTENIIILPGISTFVGADITAALNFIEQPAKDKYNILLDLGTNAEIALIGQGKIICTSAAAGPCFEGINISCGMTATVGAIYNVDDNFAFSTIGGEVAKGICATGLIDLISVLRKKNVINSVGYMDDEEFPLDDKISLSIEDIRQFQLAKSAVYSGIISLLHKADISFEDIDRFYVSGGFSDRINIDNAVAIGLFPKELKERFSPLGNSCLKGLIKYAAGKRNIENLIPTAEYFDLTNDSIFAEEFIRNLSFN